MQLAAKHYFRLRLQVCELCVSSIII
jgi:hypothetical protein